MGWNGMGHPTTACAQYRLVKIGSHIMHLKAGVSQEKAPYVLEM